MAYIQQDDKLQGGPEGPNTDYPQTATGGSSTDVGSGGGGVSTAGIGAGGTGGWTNVQSYLEANKGNNQSASALKSTVGSEFDKEEQGLQSKANEAKTQANQYQPLSDNDVNDALAGSPEKAQSVKSYLTGSYGGPSEFSYGLGTNTQNYGSALANDGAFKGLMGNIYNKAAGGQMSQGQLALQNQMDVSNADLGTARQDLANRYQGLTGTAANTVKSTQDYLKSAQDTYSQGQQRAKERITGEATSAHGALQDLMSKKDTWNETKQGSYQDAHDQAQARYNYLQNLIGLGGETTGTPAPGTKDDVLGSVSEATGGDGMASMPTVVDPKSWMIESEESVPFWGKW